MHIYRIPGNFRGRKLSRELVKNTIFAEKTFRGLLTFAVPKDATLPNFAENTECQY